MSARLDVTGLSHTYAGAEHPVVAGLDLVVEQGELLALLGPSGCGKTTVLKLIAGLLRPTAGDVVIGGSSVLGVRPEHRAIAMVFQRPLLFPHMDVARNVGFGLRMRGVTAGVIDDRVARYLELVRLPGFGPRDVASLSGGQQQRVSLARALITEPALLLLDEPFSALDANLRGEMRDLLRAVQDELGVTALFVTHDQEEAAVLADRVALLLDGRVRQVGAPATLHRRPASVAVASFFGTQNLLAGELVDGRFTCGLGALDVTVAEAFTGAGVLTLRQEAVAFGPGANQRTARVRRTLDTGTAVQVWLEVDGVPLRAVVGPEDAVGPGEERSIHLDPSRCWVVPHDGG